MLELYYRDTLTGTIKNERPDELAMVREIDFTPAAAHYKHLFAFFNDPHARMYQSPPFSEELIENWFNRRCFRQPNRDFHPGSKRDKRDLVALVRFLSYVPSMWRSQWLKVIKCARN